MHKYIILKLLMIFLIHFCLYILMVLFHLPSNYLMYFSNCETSSPESLKIFRSSCLIIINNCLFLEKASRIFLAKILTYWGYPFNKCIIVDIFIIFSGSKLCLFNNIRTSMQNLAINVLFLSTEPRPIANYLIKSADLFSIKVDIYCLRDEYAY